jgi:uncharacterized membrane protein YqjE
MMDNDPRSFARLLADAVDQFAKLLRSEIAVARAELAEKAGQAASGAALLLVAGLLLIPVVVVLLLALASWLSELGLRPSLAQLCAGFAGLVVVGVLALIGKSRVSPRNLSPTRTLNELARNADATKRAL